jgi:hypothetical protein
MLVPFRESEAFAAAINELLGDPRRRAQMEQAAYIYGKRMHWPTVGRAYSQLFHRLAAWDEERQTLSSM